MHPVCFQTVTGTSREQNKGTASQVVAFHPAHPPSWLTSSPPGTPMAQGGNVPDGGAFSPSFAKSQDHVSRDRAHDETLAPLSST
jgi:hypothetical protein